MSRPMWQAMIFWVQMRSQAKMIFLHICVGYIPNSSTAKLYRYIPSSFRDITESNCNGSLDIGKKISRGCAGDRIGTRFLRPRCTSTIKGSTAREPRGIEMGPRASSALLSVNCPKQGYVVLPIRKLKLFLFL